MSMGTWRIPDVMEPLHGVRIWTVEEKVIWKGFASEEGTLLKSYSARAVYETKELTFECDWHEKPDKHCQCGIWGCWNPEDIEYAIRVDPFEANYVLGRIKGWGTCIIADRGFRAEHIEILSFIDNGHPNLPALAQHYGIPIEEDSNRKMHVVKVPVGDVRDAPAFYIKDFGQVRKWDLLQETSVKTQKELQAEGWYVTDVHTTFDRDNYTLTFKCTKTPPELDNDF